MYLLVRWTAVVALCAFGLMLGGRLGAQTTWPNCNQSYNCSVSGQVIYGPLIINGIPSQTQGCFCQENHGIVKSCSDVNYQSSCTLVTAIGCTGNCVTGGQFCGTYYYKCGGLP